MAPKFDLQAALANPTAALEALDRIDARSSFMRFTAMAWPNIDPKPYIHNWHMDCVADHLVACHEGEINRVLFNVPPGTSKSSAVGVFFPAWLWGPAGKPETRFMSASHDVDIAERDNMRSRDLILTDWFQARWPTRFTVNRADHVETTARGFRRASAFASMTGHRGDYVNLDDPLSAEGADSEKARRKAVTRFRETLTTRMIDPISSIIIVIMQRLHAEDVSGEILAKEMGYTHVMLPMEFETERRCYTVVKPGAWWRKKTGADPVAVRGRYDADKQIWYLKGQEIPEERRAIVEAKPLQRVYSQDPREHENELLFSERFPREVVDRDNKAMGSYASAGQQQQRPVPRGGGLFKRVWFRTVPAHEAPKCIQYVRAWDLAATADPNAAATAGLLMGVTAGPEDDREFVIFDVKREQLSPSGVRRLIQTTARHDFRVYGGLIRGSLPKDPGAGGKAWAQSLVGAAAGYDYRASPETGDKMTRARPLAAQAEVGNVILVEGPWVDGFLTEAEQFGPTAKFKDQVDAGSRAFMELAKPQGHALQGKQR